MHLYRAADADTIVVALGSVLGTIKDAVDELREEGMRVGVLGLTCFRPWPHVAIREALARARRVVVIEKSLAVGLGGIVSANVRGSYTGRPDDVHAVIAGLGGRPITKRSLQGAIRQAVAGKLDPLTFLDLNREVVERVLAREREVRRSGPIAESVLRDLGVAALKTG